MDPRATSQLATDLFSDGSFERWRSWTAEERLDNSKELITVHGVYFVSEFFLPLVKKLRYWFEYIGVRAVLRIVPLLPIALLRMLADGAGWLVYHLDRKNPRVALANLEAAFGAKFTANKREPISRLAVHLFG